ncbi:hypothetical protein [Roseibium sediminicola]|uniref:Uncharacterized protein n=1 Tax=Roseibium sediminicola TaxID=2933272 RepID=A0ABT0GNV7_9HYPH|nr:hypothetical protein [Roseibium sp. CAU 1639]MCK7611107.1 hypothetical protein [Roseibium sp. CAU 1639]
MQDKSAKSKASLIAAVFAMLFGSATILSGGWVLFGGDGPRTAAGAVVDYVLWFNFLAGFGYVFAGIGILKRQRWTLWLALAVLTGTFIVFLVFLVHVLAGGAHEIRTFFALIFRLAFLGGMTMIARSVGGR